MPPSPAQASPEEGADAAFFEYVAQSYRYFMAGDDEKCEAVDASKAAEFDERAGEITSATQRLLAVRAECMVWGCRGSSQLCAGWWR